LCQYIRNKDFFVTHFWQYCVSTSHTTELSSHSVGYTVSIFQRQTFSFQKMLVTLCQYIRPNNFLLPFCWLHCVNRKTQHFYSHTHLVTLWQYVRENSFVPIHCCQHCVYIMNKHFILMHSYLDCVSISGKHFLNHSILVTLWVYITEKCSILTHCCLHSVSIFESKILSSLTLV